MIVSETGSVQSVSPLNDLDHVRFAPIREVIGRIGLFLRQTQTVAPADVPQVEQAAAGPAGAVAVAGLILGLLCGPAAAHTAASGWSYDLSCCSTQDCTAVPDGRVTAGPDGWRVSLRPGDHPFAPDGMSVVVPYADKRNRVSGDEHFHVCIGRITRKVLCVYAPPMGF